MTSDVPYVPTMVDQKIAASQQGIHNLKTRMSDVERGVNQQGKRIRLAGERADRQQSQIDKLTNAIRAIGDKLTDTHDRTVTGQTDIDERVNSLIAKALADGQSGGRKSFLMTLRSANVDDETIKRVLLIFQEGDVNLTDEQLFTELFTSFVAMDSRVEVLQTQMNSVRSDIVDLRGVHIPLWGWIVSAVLGIVGFLWWLLHDWGTAIKTVTSTAKTSAGTATVNNTLTMRPAADHWYFALLFGVAIFLAVLGVVSLFRGVKETTVTTTNTASQDSMFRSLRATYKSRREAVKAQKAQQRANGSQLLNDVTSTNESGVMSNR